VAGRTGFVPVDTRKVTGLPKSAEAFNKMGVGHSGSVVPLQSEDQVTLGGLGESEQGTATPVTEVYRRRIEKINGAVMPLSYAIAGTGTTEDDGSEDGLEESYVEDTVEVSGDVVRLVGSLYESPPMTMLKRKGGGVVIEEMADSPITKDLKLAMEVGSMIGLSGRKSCKWTT
jgi:hypothetical protein